MQHLIKLILKIKNALLISDGAIITKVLFGTFLLSNNTNSKSNWNEQILIKEKTEKLKSTIDHTIIIKNATQNIHPIAEKNRQLSTWKNDYSK